MVPWEAGGAGGRLGCTDQAATVSHTAGSFHGPQAARESVAHGWPRDPEAAHVPVVTKPPSAVLHSPRVALQCCWNGHRHALSLWNGALRPAGGPVWLSPQEGAEHQVLTTAAYLERICSVKVGLSLVQLASGPGCSSCTPQQQRHNTAVDARKVFFFDSGDTQMSCRQLAAVHGLSASSPIGLCLGAIVSGAVQHDRVVVSGAFEPSWQSVTGSPKLKTRSALGSKLRTLARVPIANVNFTRL